MPPLGDDETRTPAAAAADGQPSIFVGLAVAPWTIARTRGSAVKQQKIHVFSLNTQKYHVSNEPPYRFSF